MAANKYCKPDLHAVSARYLVKIEDVKNGKQEEQKRFPMNFLAMPASFDEFKTNSYDDDLCCNCLSF